MTSPFDPATFAQMTFNRVGSTEAVLVPEAEYPMAAEKYEFVPWASEEKGTSGLKVVFTLVIEDTEKKLQELTGRDKNAVRYEMFLDTMPAEAGGGLDFGLGKNLLLNRYLTAAGIQDGQPWSFDSLIGRRVIGMVKHDMNKKTQIPFAVCRAVRGA